MAEPEQLPERADDATQIRKPEVDDDLTQIVSRPASTDGESVPQAANPTMRLPESAANADVLGIGALVNDRFEIGRVLGRGGMGVVYLATDRRTGTNMCVRPDDHIVVNRGLRIDQRV